MQKLETQMLQTLPGLFLPHSDYLEISAKLKIWQVSDCKIGQRVALFSEGTNQLASHPVPYLLNQIFSVTTDTISLKF